MKTAPTKDEIRDQIILGLADSFEAGNPHGQFIEHDKSCPEEFEPLRECLVEMIAEGWLARSPLKLYCLTPAGYRHFKPRIQALRAFS
jgi:hypothetical protein